jgi:hypothetical protein
MKKKGWINVYCDKGHGRNHFSNRLHSTEQEAINHIDKSSWYITTIYVEWEENK